MLILGDDSERISDKKEEKMSKYISLLMLLALFFVGCDKYKAEDCTDIDAVVCDSGLRQDLVVVSSKKIPQTDLAEVTVEHKNNQYRRFKLVTSQSTIPQKGDSVDVVMVCYYMNSDGVRTWRKIFAVKKR